MSGDSEFERLLQEAREVLPEPDAAATVRARERALEAFAHRTRRRLRATLPLVAAALAAVVAGFGVGALLAPRGSASPGPTGFGFVAAPGWTVVQNGADATRAEPAIAVSANVPLRSEDAGTSLPYATLLSLPPRGAVIVATFTRRGNRWHDRVFPRRDLPLSLRDASPHIDSSAQVRPQQPLGQYQLRAAVNGYNVDVNVYFGRTSPPAATVAAAQRQLDRLVVRPPRAVGTRRRALPLRQVAAVAAGGPRVFDRTYSCAVADVGTNYHELGARGHSGTRASGAAWARLPFAALSTGFVTSRENILEDSLAWISAGSPANAASLEVSEWFNGVVVSAQMHGTLAVNTRLCKRQRARVPLTAKALSGGVVGQLGAEYDCETPRRVLVRVRVTSRSPIRLSRDRAFLKARVGLEQGYAAVRTLSGRPLVFAAVAASGKTRIFTSSRCLRG